ncbi:MAG: hypothetical protein JRF47_08730 [Deltaproteobacteria bacterium]|nr:hypothetical protein [Deltaproteobacteria bacterium]
MEKGDSVKEKRAGCGVRGACCGVRVAGCEVRVAGCGVQGNVKVNFKPVASEGFIRK